MAIIMIACTDSHFGIGNANNDLLFNFPKDIRYFKSVTSGKTIVMGRKTWESLPIRPLKRRKNIVLTTQEDYVAEGATIVHSIESVLEQSKGKDVYVIGGAEIYKALMPFADKLLMTHVHTKSVEATVFFPEITTSDWKIIKVSEHFKDEQHPHNFTFATYERRYKDESNS